MSVLIPFMFDSQRQIGVWVSFDEQRSLIGGAGVHRFVMAMQVDGRNTLPMGTPVLLSGTAWLVTSGSRDYLGQWTTEKPVALYAQPSSAQLVLELRDDQLALIDHRRLKGNGGGGVRLELEIHAALTGGLLREETPPASRWPWQRTKPSRAESGPWPVAHNGHTVTFTPGQWAELLAGINAHAALTVVLPIPVFDADAHAVGVLLRDAIKLVSEGQAAKAVIDARRAIETMDRAFGDLDTRHAAIRTIVDIPPTERNQEQRFTLVRHALFSLASPSAHGDAHADTFTWNRETALAVIAAVAALGAARSEVQTRRP
jgi:hypothetical protein